MKIQREQTISELCFVFIKFGSKDCPVDSSKWSKLTALSHWWENMVERWRNWIWCVLKALSLGSVTLPCSIPNWLQSASCLLRPMYESFGLRVQLLKAGKKRLYSAHRWWDWACPNRAFFDRCAHEFASSLSIANAEVISNVASMIKS